MTEDRVGCTRKLHLNERGRYLLFAWGKRRLNIGGWDDFVAAADKVKDLMIKFNELLLDEPDKVGHIFDTEEFIVICYGKSQPKGKWCAISEPARISVKEYEDEEDKDYETDWGDDD